MLFLEALELLKQGKHVARQEWKEEDGYLAFMPGMKHIWKILPYPNPNAGNHILSVEEIEANDWFELSELVKLRLEPVVEAVAEVVQDAA